MTIGRWQDQTRQEWEVKIRTPLGTIRTEYRLTKEDAEKLRDRYEVVGIQLVNRILDY